MRIAYRRVFGVVERIDWCINNLFKLMLVPLVLIGAYALYDQGQLENDAVKAASLAKEFVNETDDSVDFEALLRQNSEVVAWLRIPDTNVDFPVMKGTDNSYYLSHGFSRNYEITGGIFLDYRNKGDFTDGFSIIYGHRMSSGRMFSDVGKFENEEFFNNHREATLYLPGQKLRLVFVAFASVYGVQGEIYNVGAFRKDESVAKVLEEATIINNAQVDAGSNYILLSTCSAKEQAKRDVLLAVIER